MLKRKGVAITLALIFVATGIGELYSTLTSTPTLLTCAAWAIWGIGAGAAIANLLIAIIHDKKDRQDA